MQKNNKVLFFNAYKKDGFYAERIHMGLTLLGSILTRNGIETRVIDYSYLTGIKDKVKVPSVEDAIAEFNPSVVGVSVFTYLYDESFELIGRVARSTDAPIIVGGPHVTLFPSDFTEDKRISYIVRGEAESVILDLVRGAKKEPSPRVINSPIPSAEDIPEINLDIALGSEFLKDYQIQLSRGCPFNCSFCSIDLIAGRRVRPRDLDACIEQIETALNKYKSIITVSITDDCPTFNRKRFKSFLQKIIDKRIEILLTVDNMRADLIDDEMLDLYALAGGQNICLGVESGNPEVFKLVHKGESLDTIIKAAKLIKAHNLSLGLCFVIGLPEDTLERHMSSIKLAKDLKPDYIYWNMCTPWPGTEIYEWFKKHGEIGDVRNFSTLINSRLEFKEPPALSIDFPKEERIKAWLMANLETYNIPIFSLSNLKYLPSTMKRLLELVIKYRLFKSFFIMLWQFVSRKLWYEVRRKITFRKWAKKRKTSKAS